MLVIEYPLARAVSNHRRFSLIGVLNMLRGLSESCFGGIRIGKTSLDNGVAAVST